MGEDSFEHKNHKFCIKTYFKTRALKQIIQWLIISAVSILMLGVFAVADAYAAYAPEQCSNFTDTAGTAVAPGNSGVLDTVGQDPMYVGRICKPTSTPTSTDYLELDGWIWNDNLGWVSLFCDNFGLNRGIPCGAQWHSVKIDINTGKMFGWAWGDNIGWISFACPGPHDVAGENEGYPCGGAATYGGDASRNSDATIKIDGDIGEILGYIWADTVGYMNLEGLYVEMLKLVVIPGGENLGDLATGTGTPWGVWTKSEIEDTADEQDFIDGGGAKDKTLMPAADGSEGYDIFVHVADIGGFPIDQPDDPDIEVEIETLWIDTVKYDQTDETILDTYEEDNLGAAQKPSVLNSGGYDLTYKAGETTLNVIGESHHEKVISYAPTDSGNCYTEDNVCDGDDGELRYIAFGDGVQPNNLVYRGATVVVRKTSAPAEQVTLPINPIGFPAGRPINFVPPWDIEIMDFLTVTNDFGSGINVIRAVRNKADQIYMQGVRNAIPPGAASVVVELDEGPIPGPEEQYDFLFVADEETDPSVDGTEYIAESNILSLGPVELAIPFAPDSALVEFITNAVIRSTVVINPPGLPQQVKYFNNGLPRTLTSIVRNQRAEILSGTIFSPGAEQIATDTVITFVGDIASYDTRNQYLYNVDQLVGPVPDLVGGALTINLATPAATLAAHRFANGQVYYFRDGDVTIEEISVLQDTSPDNLPVTIIVEGGDLFLKSDIYDTDTHWGFIVLETDDIVPIQDKGGRMYVHNRVKDLINVHIFLDGPLFRYSDGAEEVCYYWGVYNALLALREPNYVSPSRVCSSVGGSFRESDQVINDQLFVRGDLTSFNCIGCSALSNPHRGDGKDLGGASAINYAIARLYDLNYLSYYSADALNPFPGAKAQTVIDRGMLPPDDAFPVYFEYSSAPNNQLGFVTITP